MCAARLGFHGMDEVLITAVYIRRPIWNPTDELRKNSKILTKLWDEVAQETGIDVKAVKARWKNLRAYYVRELRKVNESAGATGTGKTSFWQHFEQLGFLRDVIAKDGDWSGFPGLPDPGEFDAAGEMDDDNKFMIQSLITDHREQGREIKRDDGETGHRPSLLPPSSSHDRPPPQPPRRPKRPRPYIESVMKRNETLITLEERVITLLDRVSASQEDDDLQFFKSLLPCVKSLPQLRKMRLRREMQGLVLQALEEFNAYV